MNNIKLIWVGILIAIVIAVGGYSYPQQIASALGAVANRLPHGYWDTADGYYVDGVSVIDGSGNIVVADSKTLSLDGIVVYGMRTTMSSATTTPCSIQGPAATSTLKSWTANITTGTSTAMSFDMSTSTTAYATTSNPLIKFGTTAALASGAQGSFAWHPGASTSPFTIQQSNDYATGASLLILKPNTWVVMKTGAGVGGFTYTGTCSAVFEAL